MAQGIIDFKGRVFGKINIIDLFCLIIIFMFLPAMLVGYKGIERAKAKRLLEASQLPEYYLINGKCKYCGFTNKIKVKYAQLPPKEYKNTCKNCGIKSYLIKPSPLKPAELTWSEKYFKRLEQEAEERRVNNAN